MKKSLVYILAIAAVAIAAIFVFADTKAPNNEQGNNGNGGVKCEKMSTDKVKLDTPCIDEKITSPLVVEGEARGVWFFEASFPIKVEDDNGNVLGQSYVMSQEDWMTEEFVPFSGKIEFSDPQTNKGFLVLEKDNPSGLPEHAESLRVPVRFR